MLSLLLALACATSDLSATPVRATLDDGQVLLGQVQTETLQLQTGFGPVQVPLSDIGEVRPVEGGALGSSGNQVSVWLRNGSELRGQWTEPELQMGLSIGDQIVDVDLPVSQLERFQLLGGELLPEGFVYRVRTVYGDDFVVDPERTVIGMENALGHFEPLLDEVLSLAPLGVATGDWHMELWTGTELIGPLLGEDLRLVLPLGPEEVRVPIQDIVSIERQDWGGYSEWSRTSGETAGEGAAIDTGIWFDNRRQSDFKLAH